jgi:GGDEF domain-containing protein
LGFDHLVLSARLLSHWGLPADFCAAISVPPDEKRINDLTQQEAKLPRILHLAHLLERAIDQPYGSCLNDLLAIGSRYCKLTNEDLQPIVAAVQQKVGDMAEALSLQLPEGQSHLGLLVEAHEQLANECVAAPGRGNGWPDEKSLLQLTMELRADVTRCTRQKLVPVESHEVSASVDRSPAAAAKQRTTTVNDEDGFEPVLESKVAMAIGRARQNRQPLALAIVEIDCFADLLVRNGPAAAGELIFELRESFAAWNDQGTPILLSDSRLALLWEESSRSEAMQLARELLSKVRQSSTFSLSIGLATLDFAPKNYPGRQLTEAALGCLSAAQLSGGNTVKSIAV